MNLKIFLHHVTTLGPIGYMPAPGTCASLVTVPIIYWASTLSLFHYVIMTIISVFAGYTALSMLYSNFKHQDPQEIVIDEFIGMLITFLAVPITLYSVIIGFVLFRIFDIFKVCGVSWFEKIDGPWAILLDDIWAGVLSCTLLHILKFNGFFS